ncbi:hypothetical protein [Neogemmobacter tilapiae]|uniref:Uncharacterized protein n=1 Tax=Neogemmobacter tilapiae TaxID=875041 RepID=A0A918TE17_9RHOB|nr:hypothetical protein [Gemmobacter tilapiae]GHC44161.1 hypothetical protein GCM10007315_01640 [Gemmobacter tilapiae]
MDIQRLLQQMGSRLLRRFLTKGVMTGINKVAGKGKRGSGGAGSDAAQRMRQTQKMMRRFRR